ncbi:hypothetical protein [Afipia sp. P52-10]|uniref:hypothetical protein n=1 Tax=Afipia sp. P52-10 TaxID=1429916 RepID=UPI001269594A|nr:hypothetical protein [Afipia sp. P52-10]
MLDQLAAEMRGSRAKFDHGRRRVFDLYTKLIQNGIDAGELRSVDARRPGDVGNSKFLRRPSETIAATPMI